MSSANRLKQLLQFGQSVWCDNVDRKFLREGVFQKMIREDGLRGVTSNPTIFEKAITQSNDYDAELTRLVEQGKNPEEVYWALVIKDIQDVADIFLPVFKETKGHDGFVSIEVNPLLANDTQGTIKQAKELWQRVNRPNLMVKIPATREGLPAIEASIAEGININVTLIFSIERHIEVMNAYLAGLEKRVAADKPVEGIASVASFFVSRVDTEVDKRLEEKIAQSKSGAEKDVFSTLMGRAAIANSKLAYAEYENIFVGGSRFAKLKAKGAQVQRPLWASTSTKNPKYRDVIYVEELIGPDTVDTMPPATIDAFRDHGSAKNTLKENVDKARWVFAELKKYGIDMADVTHQLELAGVKSFSGSYHNLIKCVEDKEVKIGAKK